MKKAIEIRRLADKDSSDNIESSHLAEAISGRGSY
jgi:hypothetical protein